MLDYKEVKKLFCIYECKQSPCSDNDLCYDIRRFIECGRENGIIEKTHIERAREAVKFYNEHNPYKIHGKVTNKDESITFPDPHMIFIQDLNRIVANYEADRKKLKGEE